MSEWTRQTPAPAGRKRRTQQTCQTLQCRSRTAAIASRSRAPAAGTLPLTTRALPSAMRSLSTRGRSPRARAGAEPSPTRPPPARTHSRQGRRGGRTVEMLSRSGAIRGRTRQIRAHPDHRRPPPHRSGTLPGPMRASPRQTRTWAARSEALPRRSERLRGPTRARPRMRQGRTRPVRTPADQNRAPAPAMRADAEPSESLRGKCGHCTRRVVQGARRVATSRGRCTLCATDPVRLAGRAHVGGDDSVRVSSKVDTASGREDSSGRSGHSERSEEPGRPRSLASLGMTGAHHHRASVRPSLRASDWHT
jgi:hypothetical protein